jgi:hypothetical protein
MNIWKDLVKYGRLTYAYFEHSHSNQRGIGVFPYLANWLKLVTFEIYRGKGISSLFPPFVPVYYTLYYTANSYQLASKI